MHNISYNLSNILGIVDCSLHTRSVDVKDDYHESRMVILACISAEDNHLEILAEMFLVPVRQNQFIHKNISKTATVH